MVENRRVDEGDMAALTTDQRAAFGRDGFVVLPGLLDRDRVGAVAARFDPLFSGDFETGVYPDEWYWRPGMSLPDVTRHMGNAWKSDRTLARLVTSPALASLVASLLGWDGVRLGQDTLWAKPPLGKAVAMHQDGTFLSFLDPAEMATAWIALDDTVADGGSLSYARGSHLWPLWERPGGFHAPDGWQAEMRHAAADAGVEGAEVVTLEVPAGTVSIHHGRTWHGSAPSERADRWRRSLAVHLIPAHTRFRTTGAGYIYGRYQRPGETQMDEAFFPVLWTAGGYRSAWLDPWLEAGAVAVWSGPSNPEAA